MTYLFVFLYAAAIVTANLLVATFGPSITPINAFFLIGMDLALRNILALRINKTQMICMIIGTGAVSYLLNPASGMIAIASCASFVVASVVDWMTFNTVTGRWFKRNLAGNTAGALVDSIVFPTLAFGHLIPVIVAAQFLAKVVGGSFFGWIFTKTQSDK
jgi:uncharacterized PurR-regulated membrane protein YhhQ (DUF165 family)